MFEQNKYKCDAKRIGILILILSLMLFEFLATVILYFNTSNETRIVGAYKLVFELFFTVYFIYNYNRLSKTTLIPFGILFIILIINQLFVFDLIIGDFEFSLVRGNFYFMNRFLFPIFFISCFLQFFSRKLINQVVNFFNLILIINVMFIVLGLIFKLDMFKSYMGSSRFGYDGLFNMPNQASFYYIVSSSFFYIKYLKSKKQDRKSLLIMIFLLIGSLLIGTKLNILFFGLLLLHFLIYNRKYKLFITTILIGLIAVIYSREIFLASEFWSNLAEGKSTLTLLTSTRNLRVENTLQYYSDYWDWFNYFIGGPFYDRKFMLTEMGFFDIFTFTGLLGFFTYFFWLHDKVNNHTFLVKTIFFIVLFCDLISGSMMVNMTQLIFLVFTYTSLNLENDCKPNTQLF